MFTVAIGPRDFTAGPGPDNVALAVENYAWSALGGPAQATIRANGPAAGLDGLLDWLRCPVTIRHVSGEAVWWGYVQAVNIQDGASEYGASLAGMFNSVRVAYSYIAPGTNTTGERRTYPDKSTTALQDADSVNTYGQKDALISAGGASDAAAQAAAARLLATLRYPQAALAEGSGSGRYATLICAGWWDTLGWRYYRNTGTASVETTAQIAAMAAGGLLAGTLIVTASGLSGSEYRDGDTTAQAEITALLAQGISAGRPLWASVTAERILEVTDEAVGVAYRWRRDGQLETVYGDLLPPWRPVCAAWVSADSRLPIYSTLAGLTNITERFITGWSYRPGAVSPGLTFRGQPTPFDLAGIANR